eukprot:scaffold394846_cov22-Prasinocladus_malaysianus.AAC.1
MALDPLRIIEPLRLPKTSKNAPPKSCLKAILQDFPPRTWHNGTLRLASSDPLKPPKNWQK